MLLHTNRIQVRAAMRNFAVLLLVACQCGICRAAVTVPRWFGDNMVCTMRTGCHTYWLPCSPFILVHRHRHCCVMFCDEAWCRGPLFRPLRHGGWPSR